jgi:hypothetical protein
MQEVVFRPEIGPCVPFLAPYTVTASLTAVAMVFAV